MTLNECSTWLCSLLKPELFPADPSMNGIQVGNSAPDTKQIRKIAFAVDACLETIEKAAAEHADLLVVHHGMFWGQPVAVSGAHYKRIKALMDADMALFACHIPLDANAECGNNYGIARRIGLEGLEPFGFWHGMQLGVIGSFPEPLSREEICARLLPDGEAPLAVLPFGPEEITRVAVISGGAGEDVDQAIEAGADAYITGAIEHEQYHVAKEHGITVIAGGHYNTETVGVSLVMEKIREETGVETVFIKAPTEL